MCTSLLSAIVFVASVTRILNALGIDEWCERRHLEQMNYSISRKPPDYLRLIYIEESDILPDAPKNFADESARQLWRAAHAKLLTALSKAGARIVAFDMFFPTPDDDKPANQKADRQFLQAIQEVHSGGKTHVIVGAELDGQTGQPKFREALPGAEWGMLEIGGHRQEVGQQQENLRRILLARSLVGVKSPVEFEPVAPSLPLQILLATKSAPGQAPARAVLDARHSRLVLWSGSTELGTIPCGIEIEKASPGEDPHRLATIPLHMARLPTLSKISEKYSSVSSRLSSLNQDYANQIVLIGARLSKNLEEEGEAITLVPEGKRNSQRPTYGYEVHASVLSDLLEGTYPRRLGLGWQFLVLFVLCIVAGVGRTILPRADLPVDLPVVGKYLGKTQVPLALIILTAMYLVAIWIFYRSAFLLFDDGYGLLAIGSGYYISGGYLLRHPPGSPKNRPAMAICKEEEAAHERDA